LWPAIDRKRKAPFYKRAFPFYEAFRPGLSQRQLTVSLASPRKLLRGSEDAYFFFFLPAFFFIFALSLLLDLTVLVVGFFLAGIDTSS
jgi:hypothetical protein